MFKKKNGIKTSSGFTLIELLIVIVIIGIMAGIVLLLINPARQQRKSKETILKANTNKLCLALYACSTTAGDVTQCDSFVGTELASDIADLRGAAADTANAQAAVRATSAPAYATYSLGVAGQIVTITGSLPGSNTNPGGSGAATAANPCVFTCTYDFATGDAAPVTATVPANCVQP